ncbi:MAG: hypothetical protein JWO36_3392 [Myxococcales bacterium]|nr:hypothetical protein [Myxococcales bacterium]
MRALSVLGLFAIAACAKGKPLRNLDLDVIRVTEARLRTDTVGDGEFASVATFVLVDADNTAKEGAYVSLGGELESADKTKVGELKTQSLWIPAGATRTFALVDLEHQARPAAAAAKIKVRGALVPETPPAAHVEEVREVDDYGKMVVQGTLVNDADRPGQVMVIASFHDADGKPMTRPFTMMNVEPKTRQSLQFVGPQGSKHGTIFVGDAIF